MRKWQFVSQEGPERTFDLTCDFQELPSGMLSYQGIDTNQVTEPLHVVIATTPTLLNTIDSISAQKGD